MDAALYVKTAGLRREVEFEGWVNIFSLENDMCAPCRWRFPLSCIVWCESKAGSGTEGVFRRAT